MTIHKTDGPSTSNFQNTISNFTAKVKAWFSHTFSRKGVGSSEKQTSVGQKTLNSSNSAEHGPHLIHANKEPPDKRSAGKVNNASTPLSLKPQKERPFADGHLSHMSSRERPLEEGQFDPYTPQDTSLKEPASRERPRAEDHLSHMSSKERPLEEGQFDPYTPRETPVDMIYKDHPRLAKKTIVATTEEAFKEFEKEPFIRFSTRTGKLYFCFEDKKGNKEQLPLNFGTDKQGAYFQLSEKKVYLEKNEKLDIETINAQRFADFADINPD